LIYFITIVQCDFNLTKAAEKIHISQSALSKFILKIEQEQNIQLFERKNHKILALSPIGEVIYEYGQEISALYNEMQSKVQELTAQQKQTIRLGIPSILIPLIFQETFSQIIKQYPQINLDIIEGGSVKVQELLANQQIDIAIYIEPIQLDERLFQSEAIAKIEYYLYLDANHPLQALERINWEDVVQYPIATLNKEYTTYGLMLGKLQKVVPGKDIAYSSSTWNYLLDLTEGTQIVSILPYKTHDPQRNQSVVVRTIEDPLIAKIIISSSKQRQRDKVQPIFDYIKTQIN
ncbi:MAG: LysR family transcriptional regulator, partial [Gallicola sp.]|nr:LysR family transcriptional regulator [Gallicola sp.]